jgi:peptidoglycan hydrolase-like protein with peptidoglycan-binding domain
MKKHIKLLFATFLFSTIFIQTSFAQVVPGYSDITSGLFCQNVTGTLSQGTRSYGVSTLQSLLREKYAYNVSSTGYYGPVTDRVVRSLQKTMGIAYPSGAVGPLTLSKLRSVWCDNVTNPNNNNISINITPSFSQNNNVTLTWASQNTNACTLNGENVSTSGNKVVTVYSESVYKIRCTNSQGASLEKNITVTPSATTPAPQINFYTSPSDNLIVGQNVSLVWTVTNANSCTLNGSQVGVSGVQNTIVPNSAVSYVLSCNGNGGSSSKTISLNQTNIPGQDYLNTNASSYNVGNSMTITWKAPVAYASDVQGVILDLVKDGKIVGTINRVQGPSNSIQGTYNFTIPQGIRDIRNDAITCTAVQTSQGTTEICGNLVTSGTYKIRATYFTPFNACFGYCPPDARAKVLGTYESSSFTISSPVVNSSQNVSLSISSINGVAQTANSSSQQYIPAIGYNQPVTVVVNVKNNGANNVVYPSGSGSCPSDVTLAINGIDFYTLTNQTGRICTMDYQTVTLTPGSSYTRTFSGTLNGTLNPDIYVMKVDLKDANRGTVSTNSTNISIIR